MDHLNLMEWTRDCSRSAYSEQSPGCPRTPFMKGRGRVKGSGDFSRACTADVVLKESARQRGSRGQRWQSHPKDSGVDAGDERRILGEDDAYFVKFPSR